MDTKIIYKAFLSAAFIYVARTCSQSNFNPANFNQKMEGHVIESKEVPSLSKCIYDCMLTTDCLSYNFYMEKSWCEMNSENSSTSPESLVPITEWIQYSDINVWPQSIARECKGFHCPPRHRCVPATPIPLCIYSEIDCGKPPARPNAKILPGTTKLGSLRQYICIDGYGVSPGSEMTIKCQPTSYETAISFKCIRAENCVDCNAECPHLASIGECNINPAYMLVYCKLSCNVCSEVESCADCNADCPHWASIGQCEINPTYMLVYCRLSCNVCSEERTLGIADDGADDFFEAND